jgi:hypothetical protein
MQKEGNDGKGTGPIVSVALADWQRYRMDGYIFRNDPEAPAEFAKQGKALADEGREPRESNRREPGDGTEAVDDDDDDEGVSMSNSKDEIIAYLEANEIAYDEGDTKAELLDLIE